MTNGRIRDATVCFEREAVAIEDGTIVYVGSREGVVPYIGDNTEVVDLQGKFAMPSFVDSHLHPLSNAYAYNFQAASYNQNSREEHLATIKEFADAHTEMDGFMGAGFDLYLYDGIGPKKEWLDAIDSERPIAIIDKDIHAMWVNSKVFEMLGWHPLTPHTASTKSADATCLPLIRISSECLPR